MSDWSVKGYRCIRPLLFSFDPETTHHVITALARTAPFLALQRRLFRCNLPRLRNKVFDISFENPVGVAGGFDKNARLVGFVSSLGFGFTEVGSISNQPATGNPRPRLFRLESDQALINRMGLNNDGAAAIAARLATLLSDIPIGINVVKTHNPNILEEAAIEDIVNCYSTLVSLGSFHILNISCPNTKEGKTFEDPEALSNLLKPVQALRREQQIKTPLLVKFSPDTAEAELLEAIDVCESHGIDGYVMVNTSTTRTALVEPMERLATIGNGGVSGRPLFDKACVRIRKAYLYLKGQKPIIGVGGIFSGDDAYRVIRSGASLVETYTGLVYRGPGIAKDINLRLDSLMANDNFQNTKDIIGIDA